MCSLKTSERSRGGGAVQRRLLFYPPDNINKFLGKYYLSTLSQEENQEPNKKDFYKKPLANITLKSKTPKFPFEIRKKQDTCCYSFSLALCGRSYPVQSSKFRKSEAEDMKIGKKGTKTVIHRQYACICRKNFLKKKKNLQIRC